MDALRQLVQHLARFVIQVAASSTSV
jgi:hypothetical protein